LPTAAEALAEAVAIAKSMANGVSSVERAHLWLAIARELRAGTVRPALFDDTEFAKHKLRAAALLPGQVVPDLVTGGVTPAETQVVNDPGKTQVIWAIGDKAQCRHCLTPIELCEAAIEPNAFVPDGGTAHMWRHKYTGQATCLAATMSSDAADVTHTFAEPAPR
jgi:hypothetical protein